MRATDAFHLALQRRRGMAYQEILEGILLNVQATASMGGDSLEMELDLAVPGLHERLQNDLEGLGYEAEWYGDSLYVSWDMNQWDDEADSDDLLHLPKVG